MAFAGILGPRNIAQELHRHPDGRTCMLAYRTLGAGTLRRHVVVYDRPGNPFPDSQRFWNVEDARTFWAEKRREYAAMGYVRQKREG